MRKTFAIILALSCAVYANAADAVTPNVTRAEATMLILQSRMTSVPDVRDTNHIPDVVPGSWYERYVVLGERYGLLESDPVTRRISPDAPVHRGEFLKMLTYAFGLPDQLPQHYKDVRADSDSAVYAGIAETYGLFPGDVQKNLLHPESELSHGEAAQAVWILTQAIKNRNNETTDRKTIAQDQMKYNLQLYQKISNTVDRVAISPYLEQREILAIAKNSNDAGQLPVLRTALLTLVNAERKKAGMPALKMNAVLESSAQSYANDMAGRGFFSHVTPEGSTLSDRMQRSGYYKPELIAACPDCVTRYELGENLAQGQRTPAEAVRDWMASPLHKAAILSKNFSETGFGVSAGVWVEHFGGRK